MREDALEEVRRLKSGEGSELEVSGQGLAAALIQARRVDEIGVYIISMAVGGGKHFATLERPLGLGFPGLQTESASCTCATRCKHNRVHWGTCIGARSTRIELKRVIPANCRESGITRE